MSKQAKGGEHELNKGFGSLAYSVKPLYLAPPAVSANKVPDEAIRKAKREALLEAIAECDHWQTISEPSHRCGDYIAGVLRRMVDDLASAPKSGEQP